MTDIYTFLESILTADLIRPATLDLMKTYILKKEGFSTYEYGLGLSFRNHEQFGQAIGYSGSHPGYTSEAWYFPEKNSYIIYQINTGNFLNGPLQRLIDDDFHEAILFTVFTD